MTPLNEALQQRLEAYMLRTGLHHHDVADMAGVSRRTVSMLLIGNGEPTVAEGAAINSVLEAP